jgi:hypothetical protein
MEVNDAIRIVNQFLLPEIVRMVFVISFLVIESKDKVASSKTNIDGRLSNEEAIDKRCFSL